MYNRPSSKESPHTRSCKQSQASCPSPVKFIWAQEKLVAYIIRHNATHTLMYDNIHICIHEYNQPPLHTCCQPHSRCYMSHMNAFLQPNATFFAYMSATYLYSLPDHWAEQRGDGNICPLVPNEAYSHLTSISAVNIVYICTGLDMGKGWGS